MTLIRSEGGGMGEKLGVNRREWEKGRGLGGFERGTNFAFRNYSRVNNAKIQRGEDTGKVGGERRGVQKGGTKIVDEDGGQQD